MALDPKPSRARAPKRAPRGPRILSALLAGASFESIVEAENLTRKRVEKLMRDELRRRWTAPAQDYARLQIARLEALSSKLVELAEGGDLRAIDRVLKILDRLDRYHGFVRGASPASGYEANARERLFSKINAAAARGPLRLAPPE